MGCLQHFQANVRRSVNKGNLLCKRASPKRHQGHIRASQDLTSPRRIASGRLNQRTSERARSKPPDQDSHVAADAEPPSSHPACQWALTLADEFRGDIIWSYLEPTTVGKTVQEKNPQKPSRIARGHTKKPFVKPPSTTQQLRCENTEAPAQGAKPD